MRICEECGSMACGPDDWYCDDCIAEMMCSFEDRTEAGLCTDCGEGPASVFGICDPCYDAAYGTRSRGSRALTWTPPEPVAPTIPPFHEEVQHLRWTAAAPRKKVRVKVG
ncbi:hypothetical protein SEA_OTTAWA_91 [Arthrobacter phage Ottawa]|nr:hypothetical protein SEA_KHARCHO_91 [Arthrobacter phage Kharcho]WIC89323.1 hypothetical protein SEA_OTTAWA_91 [Arthrobacter phage Ottawa]